MAPLVPDPNSFLSRIPDEPPTALARGLLLAGLADVLVDAEAPSTFALIVPADALAILPGRCTQALLREILVRHTRFEEIVFVHADVARGLELPPRLTRTPYKVYRHPTPSSLPAPGRPARVLEATSYDPAAFEGWSESARAEVERALRRGTLTTLEEDGQVVAVAHAFAATSQWYDVALEVRADRLRRGLGRDAFLALAAEQQRAGRSPLWGASEPNTASSGLALSLGFEAVSDGILIEPA